MSQRTLGHALRRGAAPRLFIAAGVVLIGLVSCAALSPAADAHVQKNKQGLYVLGVDGWRQLSKQLVTKSDDDAEQLTLILDGMREVVPPENDLERSVLEQYKKTAGEWQRIEEDWAVSTVKSVQKDLNRWEKKVKPWFARRADRRALERAVDAYMKGLTHLVHEAHGELQDAAGYLKSEELDRASDHIALGIGGSALAEQEMKDAVAALGKLK